MKKLWIRLAAALLGTAVLAGCGRYGQKTEDSREKTVQVGVAVYNGKDAFISDISEYLDKEIYEYEKKNPGV